MSFDEWLSEPRSHCFLPSGCNDSLARYRPENRIFIKTSGGKRKCSFQPEVNYFDQSDD